MSTALAKILTVVISVMAQSLCHSTRLAETVNGVATQLLHILRAHLNYHGLVKTGRGDQAQQMAR
jgi:hypothetical protein